MDGIPEHLLAPIPEGNTGTKGAVDLSSVNRFHKVGTWLLHTRGQHGPLLRRKCDTDSAVAVRDWPLESGHRASWHHEFSSEQAFVYVRVILRTLAWLFVQQNMYSRNLSRLCDLMWK